MSRAERPAPPATYAHLGPAAAMNQKTKTPATNEAGVLFRHRNRKTHAGVAAALLALGLAVGCGNGESASQGTDTECAAEARTFPEGATAVVDVAASGSPEGTVITHYHEETGEPFWYKTYPPPRELPGGLLLDTRLMSDGEVIEVSVIDGVPEVEQVTSSLEDPLDAAANPEAALKQTCSSWVVHRYSGNSVHMVPLA